MSKPCRSFGGACLDTGVLGLIHCLQDASRGLLPREVGAVSGGGVQHRAGLACHDQGAAHRLLEGDPIRGRASSCGGDRCGLVCASRVGGVWCAFGLPETPAQPHPPLPLLLQRTPPSSPPAQPHPSPRPLLLQRTPPSSPPAPTHIPAPLSPCGKDLPPPACPDAPL